MVPRIQEGLDSIARTVTSFQPRFSLIFIVVRCIVNFVDIYNFYFVNGRQHIARFNRCLQRVNTLFLHCYITYRIHNTYRYTLITQLIFKPLITENMFTSPAKTNR